MLDLSWEKSLWRQGAGLIAGVDEAGRGPLAGPVVAACVVIGPDFRLHKDLRPVRNSKLVKRAEREALFELLTDKLHYGVAMADHKSIDRLNILEATKLAMRKALLKTGLEIDHALIDGNQEIPGLPFRQTAIIDGDHLVFSIAAASIIAKVTRDRLMLEMHAAWPEYKFDQHKGYATPEHLRLLKQLGPSPIHRLSFSPLKQDTSSHLF